MKSYYKDEPQIHPIIDAIIIKHLNCTLDQVRCDYEPLKDMESFDEIEIYCMPESFKRTLSFDNIEGPDGLLGCLILGVMDEKPFAYMQDASPMALFYKDSGEAM